MKLPPIANPQRYAGLFVYDFGTHVSVGYTAQEIRILRESREHRQGTAYQIYRVTEAGGFELRGVVDERLGAREALCFLRADVTAAKGDYDDLQKAAEATPLPCGVELQLAKIHSFDPPNVAALLYDASASQTVGTWLTEIGFTGGDRLIGGIDVHATFLGANGVRVDSCKLPTLIDHADRSAEEVLQSVNEPVQR